MERKEKIYIIKYKYNDDEGINKGYTEFTNTTIGTEAEFNQMVKDEQFGQGFYLIEIIEKREATKEEIERYYNDD